MALPPKRKKRYEPEQPCRFCADSVKVITYKDVEVLNKLVTPYGKMFGRKKSGNCSRHQRQFTAAVKRARFLALLPFIGSTMKE